MKPVLPVVVALGLAVFGSAWADDSPALDGLKEKAAKGDIRAQVEVAYRYRDGIGVKRNDAEAVRWAHRAADRGDAGARDFLGWMYFEGRGVKHSPEIAFGYFKSAAGESAQAGFNLGQCYFAAQGVEQDVPKALAAWEKAAEKSGLRWKLVTFTPDDAGFAKATASIRGELDAGRPVLIDFKFTGPQYANGEAGHTLAVVGYLAKDDLYVLCNPAIATPGLQLITAADLKHYWRSNHYGAISKGVLSRPAIVIDP